MMNGKRFKVRSLKGCFCDISEIYFGRIMITRKLKCKNSERNKGNEHVFNPIVNFKSKLCHVAQYPIFYKKRPHTPSFLKTRRRLKTVNVKCVREGRNDARRCTGVECRQ